MERDEPFFRYYYVFGPSRYQVEFTFDPLAKRIDVRGIQSQTVTEQVKVVQEPVKIVEQPVRVVEQPVKVVEETVKVVEKPVETTKPAEVRVVERPSTKTTTKNESKSTKTTTTKESKSKTEGRTPVETVKTVITEQPTPEPSSAIPATTTTTSTTITSSVSSSSTDLDNAKRDELVNFVRSSFDTLPRSAKVDRITRLGERRFLIVVIVTIRRR